MAESIPQSHMDLFQKKAFAFLAVRLENGGIQVNPVWCDHDGTHVVINSAQGRAKDKAMRANPAVTLCISDPDDPYRYLEVRGKVVEISTEGADAHIDAMAKKYMGADKYPYHKPEEVRVIYRIAPERARAFPA
ncbi:MAG: PPOX class F420-dependent oxidoreductase [SAR324 cluster bacterium]|nr:PPOX class F420-dependent oxidoreductase [SAR324 cluster bacterium]MCZ6728667.1 PPOX class F420-dependent oxidoreductase [SAR324 cluster bacterium]